MIKNRSTITNIIAIASIFIAAVIFIIMLVTPAQASMNENVFGQAWGASGPTPNAPVQSIGGIGWVRMNNCNPQGVCNGPSFGVNIDNNGNFSGQAWSSNYGWVNFNGANHCPSGAPQVDLAAVALNGSAPITGFAHVTSAGTGDNFWDGCISMSGQNHAVTLNSSGSITGAAWGANVVGWVSFDAVYMIALGCTDPTATNYDPTAIIDDGSCVFTNDMCPNITGTQSTVASVNVILGSGWVYDTASPANCIVKGDMCPNILGVQATIPSGMIINPNNLYCITQILIPMCPTNPAFNPNINLADSTLCTINPPPGSPTIPIFEEI